MQFYGEQMRLVTLLKRTVTTNSQNEDVVSWDPDTENPLTDANGKMYVRWWDQGGKERMEDGQVVAIKDVRCLTRYFSGMNEVDYAIKKDGVEYDIQNAKEVNRREGWMLVLEGRDN